MATIRDDGFFVMSGNKLGVTDGKSPNTPRIKVRWVAGGSDYVLPPFLRYAEPGECKLEHRLAGKVYAEWREQQKIANKPARKPRTAGKPESGDPAKRKRRNA